MKRNMIRKISVLAMIFVSIIVCCVGCGSGGGGGSTAGSPGNPTVASPSPTTSPTIQPSPATWQRCYGGSGNDRCNGVSISTSISGVRTETAYRLAGLSTSTDGEVTGNHGGHDFWVVKTDASGVIISQQCLGGSDNDIPEKLVQTADGGVIIVGRTNSNNGDVSGNHGGFDIWVVKLNSDDSIAWQKCYGGSGYDSGQAIAQIDGGYIIAGLTESNDGDATENHGNQDFWLIKIDETGNIIWQKCYGGTSSEAAYSCQQCSDGNIIAAGNTSSNNIDVTGNHGNSDFWIIKVTENNGTILWQKCLGGSNNDNATSIEEKNGQLLIGGTTDSSDGDVAPEFHGGFGPDIWVMQTDNTASIINWQQVLGGTNDDRLSSFKKISGSEDYVIAGYVMSRDGNVSGAHAMYDGWVVKLAQNGELLWQKCWGGSDTDQLIGASSSDEGLTFIGFTKSTDGDILASLNKLTDLGQIARGPFGDADFWVINTDLDGNINQ